MPEGFEAALAAAPPVILYKQLRFAIDLRQDIINEAHLEGAEMLRAEAFTARIIQELTEVRAGRWPSRVLPGKGDGGQCILSC